MLWAWTVVFFGTLLVGAGGLVATHGWDLRGDVLRRADMLRAVAAETVMNLAIIADPRFTETDATKVRAFVIYPKLQLAALEGAIAGGLFVGEDDRLLLTRLMDVRQVAEDLNQRLVLWEAEMLRVSPDRRVAYRSEVKDSESLRNVRSALAGLGGLLKDSYGIRGDENFFVKIEP